MLIISVIISDAGTRIIASLHALWFEIPLHPLKLLKVETHLWVCHRMKSANINVSYIRASHFIKTS